MKNNSIEKQGAKRNVHENVDLLFNLLLVGDLVGLVGCCTWTLRFLESSPAKLPRSDADFRHRLRVGGEDCGVDGTD